MVGVVLGSGVFWCLFLLGIEVRLWREFGISPRDTYNLGFYEAGYWSGFTTLGGLLGLLVGLSKCSPASEVVTQNFTEEGSIQHWCWGVLPYDDRLGLSVKLYDSL